MIKATLLYSILLPIFILAAVPVLVICYNVIAVDFFNSLTGRYDESRRPSNCVW